MSTIRIYKLNEIYEVQHFLSGGITGRDVSKGVPGLAGKTITFTNPDVSITFTDGADPYLLRYLEIKDQIETADPSIKVIQFGGRIGFIEASPSTGIAIAAGSFGGHARMVGTVDLNTLEFGGGGTIDTKTFKVNVDGAGVKTVTFSAPVNSQDVVDQINGTSGLSGVASLDGDGHLVLTSTLFGALSTVALTNGTANADLGFTDSQSTTGAATNDANPLLGFDATDATAGKVYGSPYASPATAPYLIQSYSVNETTHVVYTYE